MRPALFSLVSMLCLAAACGGSDEHVPPGDDTPEHDAAVHDASLIDGGGTGAICGGIAGTACADTHWCDWDDNSCGGSDGTGTCQPRPDTCKPLEEPVCGCDGTVYPTDCAAQMAGQDVADAGGCTPAAGEFACGHLFCTAADDYCRRSVSDVAGIPDDWACIALPGGCGATPDCTCLAGETCGDMCAASGDGFVLTCPGG
jgi:hypothetical protein